MKTITHIFTQSDSISIMLALHDWEKSLLREIRRRKKRSYTGDVDFDYEQLKAIGQAESYLLDARRLQKQIEKAHRQTLNPKARGKK